MSTRAFPESTVECKILRIWATHSTFIYFRTANDLPFPLRLFMAQVLDGAQENSFEIMRSRPFSMECKFRGNYVVETYFPTVVHSNDRAFQRKPLKGQRIRYETKWLTELQDNVFGITTNLSCYFKKFGFWNWNYLNRRRNVSKTRFERRPIE